MKKGKLRRLVSRRRQRQEARPKFLGIDLGRPEPYTAFMLCDDAVLAEAMRRQFAEFQDQILHESFGISNVIEAQMPQALTIEMINAVIDQARGFQTQAAERMLAAEPRMPTTLAAMRDLLLPGFAAIEARYPIFNLFHQPPQAFLDAYTNLALRHPRIDAETAAAAKERATGLLKSLLRPEQWDELEASGTITEQIGDGEFVLRRGFHQMIEVRKRGLITSASERWCVAPDVYADGNDFMPDEDRMIGQLLHLRADPEKLRAQANIWHGR